MGTGLWNSSLSTAGSLHSLTIRCVGKGQGQEMLINFDRLPADVITLDGKLDGKQIHAKLHHIPEPRFLLNTRGFHWINEYPFNGYDE